MCFSFADSRAILYCLFTFLLEVPRPVFTGMFEKSSHCVETTSFFLSSFQTNSTDVLHLH